jgi:transcriptional regulator with XRE-family HTH domain
MEETARKIRDVIEEKIYQLGISKSELARRLGIKPHRITKALNGERSLDGEELVALCAYLGIETKELVPQNLGRRIVESRRMPDSYRTSEEGQR